MFNIFKRNKFDAQQEKIKLINTIETIEGNTSKANLYKVNSKLDDISSRLDNQFFELTKEQVDLINECLNQIGKFPDKAYGNFLLNKCSHIDRILSGEVITNDLKINMQNEDKLFEMLGQLTLIDRQTRVIEKEMDNALGKDKNMWNMLNAKKKILQNRFTVVNKNYQTLNNNIININLVADVRKGKEESEFILSQSELVDTREFTENAEYTTNVDNDVNETSNKMNEVFAMNFGGGTSDSDYEKALEQKLITEGGKSASAGLVETNLEK